MAPLPLFLLFISEPAQQMLQFYGGARQPMQLVPAWGAGGSAQAVAFSISPTMVGLQQVLTWILELSLVGWLLAAALAAWTASGTVLTEAEDSKALAAR